MTHEERADALVAVLFHTEEPPHPLMRWATEVILSGLIDVAAKARQSAIEEAIGILDNEMDCPQRWIDSLRQRMKQ
jgi:hypothetical protein